MTVQEFARTVKFLYREKGGKEFFTEKAFLSALFEKNGFSPDARILEPERVLTGAEESALLRDAARLLEGFPLQYYLGSEYFDGNEYLCAEGVLIPRRDTETLVCAAEKEAARGGAVWDLCCGSGCVGIALALRRPDLSVTAFDLSPEALVLTKKNAARLLPGRPFPAHCADVLSDAFFERLKREKPALLVSNPPYVTDAEMASLPANVRREPRLALEGGEDGLRFYRRFLFYAAKTGIPILAEIGKGQSAPLKTLAFEAGISVSFARDPSGVERVALFQKNVAENC